VQPPAGNQPGRLPAWALSKRRQLPPAREPVLDQAEVGAVEAAVRLARESRAASAAWAAGSARQSAARAAALRVEVPRLAAGRKLLTTFTEAAQAEAQAWAEARLLKRRRDPAAEAARRVLQVLAQALQQQGQVQ
jgi:hypothetical protein